MMIVTIFDARTGCIEIRDIQYERGRSTAKPFSTREKIEAAKKDILAKASLSFVVNPKPLPEFVDLEDRS